MKHVFHALLAFLLCGGLTFAAGESGKFRLGVIGTTTSHVPAFVKILNAPDRTGLYAEFEVVAAFAGGMPDNESSWGRVEKYKNELVEKGITIYPTIEAMLPQVDGILLESVDGRCHLEQAKPVIAAGKPLFIDKPIAATLTDALEIYRLAEEKKLPVFSASSLRYGSATQKLIKDKPVGKLAGCDVWSPCAVHPTHPTLVWYGIHGVETLFTAMGTGCKTVQAARTESSELVIGIWEDGRLGTFRGLRTHKTGYGGRAFGEKGVFEFGKSEGYAPLLEEVCRFFKTGKAPFDPKETIEIFAFMEAADWSVARNGAPVAIADVIKAARNLKNLTVQLNVAADGKLTLGGKSTTLESLTGELDALAGPDVRVRVILESEKGADFEIVTAVCGKLGKAVLANYVYTP